MDNNNVIIINGVETIVTDAEYISYLKQNHKPIPWQILEELAV